MLFLCASVVKNSGQAQGLPLHQTDGMVGFLDLNLKVEGIHDE